MNKISYVSDEEFEAMTEEQQLKRSDLLDEIFKGMTSKQRDEFFENLINEKLKTLTEEQQEKMAEEAIMEYDEMSRIGEAKIGDDVSDFNLYWINKWEVIFHSDIFNSLWSAYWEKGSKEADNKKDKGKEYFTDNR